MAHCRIHNTNNCIECAIKTQTTDLTQEIRNLQKQPVWVEREIRELKILKAIVTGVIFLNIAYLTWKVINP